MPEGIRSYRGPKVRKSFSAISQQCYPLSPLATKLTYTSSAQSLKVNQISSLERLRAVLYKKETTQEIITNTYLDWVNNDKCIIFEQRRHKCPIRQIASLISKGGNRKYAWKVRKQWKEFTLPFEYQQKLDAENGNLISVSETVTNVLFVSLTWDVKICDFKTAYDSISYFWNLFVANLRRKYGRVLTARVYESSAQGYPHIHCILYFPDYEFATFLKYSRKQKRHIWRIPFPEVEKLRGLWHSFIDVQGMVNLADGLKYLGKYVTKGTDLKSDDLSGKGLLTLANGYAFRKRAYSLGEKFKVAIFQKYLSLDLTRISLTQTVSEQMTLDGRLLRDLQPSLLRPFFEKWANRGIVQKEHLKRHGGIPKDYFSFGLCTTQKLFALSFFNRTKDR